MSRIFKFGIRNKCGVETDPTKLIERVKESSGRADRDRGGALHRDLRSHGKRSSEEAKQVVLAARPGLYRTIIQTALFTGPRISELLALKWPDVKLDRGTISFRRTVSTARVRATQAKKSTAGSIPRQKKRKGMLQSGPSRS
jgi:integrase